MRMRLIGWRSLFCAFGMFVCLAGESAADTVDFSVDANMAPGAGFDSVGYRVMGDCVEPADAHSAVGTAQTVTFSIQQVEDYDSLTKSLDISTSGGAKAVVWSAEGRAKLVRTLTVNNYSLYALASVFVKNEPTRMRNVKLSAEASELLRTRGGKAFHEVCGDQFVVGSTTGGEFHAIIEIQGAASRRSRPSPPRRPAGSGSSRARALSSTRSTR